MSKMFTKKGSVIEIDFGVDETVDNIKEYSQYWWFSFWTTVSQVLLICLGYYLVFN